MPITKMMVTIQIFFRDLTVMQYRQEFSANKEIRNLPTLHHAGNHNRSQYFY